MKKNGLLLALVALGLSNLYALDQKKFADNVMKFWNLDTRDNVTVGEPVPSKYGDLLVSTVTIRNNPYLAFITPDEKYFFWGEPADATKDPDQVRKSMLNLTGVHSQGSSKAPVTMVEFFNFECSHCQDAGKVLNKELYKAYTPDQVRWVMKNFPLERQEWSETAAVAAECAGAQKENGYWEMAELIFSTGGVNAGNIKAVTGDYAKRLKLNIAKFDKCYDNKETLEKVKADKLEASKLGVNSTPTFFINGRIRRGFKDIEDLKAVIDEKLKEVKK